MTEKAKDPTMNQQHHGKGWLARRAITVGAGMLAEKVRHRPARQTDEVPGTVRDLTDEWLTGWLCRDVPGARVTSFTVLGDSAGSSTRAALRVTYNTEGNRAGLPTELFAKLAASYRQRVTRGCAGAVDEPPGKPGLLREDIAATKGATFVEPVQPLERTQIEDLVENLARMHGTMWEHPDLRLLPKTPVDHFRTISAFLD